MRAAGRLLALTLGVPLAAVGCSGLRAALAPLTGGAVARGVVFDDRDGDGVRDPGEPGIEGVAVSDGREVVRTDADGRYRLGVDDDTIVFVVKPRDWMTPVDENGIPRFHYVYKPAGSPPDLVFPGVPPTGPLPAAIDFPLVRHPEPERFRAIALADTQTYDRTQIGYLERDVIAELIGTDAAFGLTLGDVVGDDLDLFEPLNRAIGRIGIPWYNVHGNHDMNYAARDDRTADETWERVYGPSTHAFQVARVHFVVLDDVVYRGVRPDGSMGGYDPGLSDRQLDFVRAYLDGVPRDDLVVLAMHIPLEVPGHPHRIPEPRRRQLFQILSGHPHTFSLSGHTHFQSQRFFGPEDGYDAPDPHHHWNVAAASGSWYGGLPDEAGLPHATMRDGTPNGYVLLDFDGNRIRVRYKAARHPASYQISISAPAVVGVDEAATAEVWANVFAGSERSTVEMRIEGVTGWTALERVDAPDPAYLAILERERLAAKPPSPPLPPAMDCPHLWRGRLPAHPPPGRWLLEVRATDVFGQRDSARRAIRFEASGASAARPAAASSR